MLRVQPFEYKANYKGALKRSGRHETTQSLFKGALNGMHLSVVYAMFNTIIYIA